MIHQYNDYVTCDCCKEETSEAYVIAYDKLCMECLKGLYNELKGMFRRESEAEEDE